ncbi:MAG: hypothetical protein QM796_02565 [Chthoniobacteraceae bacterium]
MRILFAAIAGIILTLWTSPVRAGQTETIDGYVPVQIYNSLLGRTLDAQVSVYVDDDGAAYINVNQTRGYISPKDVTKLLALIVKAEQWAIKAGNDNLEVKKELGSVEKKFSEVLTSGVSLNFVSAKNGQDAFVVMKVEDFDNMFMKETVIMSSANFPTFEELLNKVPQAVAKLKKNKEIGKEFE